MATYFGTGLVWDAEKNKLLCRFVNNKFHTTDPYIKQKLDTLGYIADREDEIVIIEDEEELQIESEDDIRAKAKELKIKSWHVKSIENLKAEIAEKEGA